ncbi:hypothetical protein E8E14_013956 [Neopestalotiopsis sp. 37M]|nr:hypothetical protein E8E14_013956 [Neopestalotiopsis sp. 37M]
MTEPEILVAFDVALDASTQILTGGHRQTSRIVMSENAHMAKEKSEAFAAQFASQLALSGAKRKVIGGHPTQCLNINHRAEGGLSL